MVWKSVNDTPEVAVTSGSTAAPRSTAATWMQKYILRGGACSCTPAHQGLSFGSSCTFTTQPRSQGFSLEGGRGGKKPRPSHLFREKPWERGCSPPTPEVLQPILILTENSERLPVSHVNSFLNQETQRSRWFSGDPKAPTPGPWTPLRTRSTDYLTDRSTGPFTDPPPPLRTTPKNKWNVETDVK